MDGNDVVDGIHLAAGTAIRWRDVDHHRLDSASPLDPVMLSGLRVSWLRRVDEGEDWNVQLPEPELVDGWMCGTIGVRVSATGQLRSCRLALGREWRDLPIPSGSFLDLTMADKVELVLPTGASMAAPEIGHRISDTSGFTFNGDGSLDSFYFNEGDPLIVFGRRLWNTAHWTYDPATYGQSRARRALAVRGSLMSAGGDTARDVVIRLSDGEVTFAE